MSKKLLNYRKVISDFASIYLYMESIVGDPVIQKLVSDNIINKKVKFFGKSSHKFSLCENNILANKVWNQGEFYIG